MSIIRIGSVSPGRNWRVSDHTTLHPPHSSFHPPTSWHLIFCDQPTSFSPTTARICWTDTKFLPGSLGPLIKHVSAIIFRLTSLSCVRTFALWQNSQSLTLSPKVFSIQFGVYQVVCEKTCLELQGTIFFSKNIFFTQKFSHFFIKNVLGGVFTFCFNFF